MYCNLENQQTNFKVDEMWDVENKLYSLMAPFDKDT